MKLRLGLACLMLVLGASQLPAQAVPAPAGTQVEFFKALADKQIEAKFIPQNIQEARLFITNKTKQPLNVQLPAAFAGVPVLAQGLGVGGGGQGNNQQQAAGGGFGGGAGGGAGGFGGGAGMFNVPAEKTADVRVNIVCLEHGKRNPRAAVPYEIRPLESFSSKPELRSLMEIYAQGGIPYEVAQAAAWHVSNGMSWQELADKRIRRADGSSYPYFTEQTLRGAFQMVSAAQRRAEENRPVSPGEASGN